MIKFVWTKKYSVGIKSIDEQHQHFFEITNSLVEMSLNVTATKEELIGLLDGLGNYALYHLGNEENYFDKFHYPDAPMHVEEHNKFREKIQKFFDSIRDEKVDVPKLAEEAAIYSGNWLFHHILLIDKKYTKFFQEHNIK